MERIFKKPLILNGEDGNVVLIYSKYIISNITKEIADLCIERIDKNLFNVGYFESIIKIKEIFKYKFKPEKDSYIKFGVKNITGTSYVTIGFKDVETTKQAEMLFMDQFKQLGFKRNEKQVMRAKALIFPLMLTLLVVVVGSLLAWFVFGLQYYDLAQTKMVDNDIYLLEKSLKIIGYYPVIGLTILMFIWSVFWAFKKVSHLPRKVSSHR